MIFVVGYSRSGTTMMGRILGQNSKVHTFGELHFFEHMLDGAAIVARPELGHEEAHALVTRLLTSSRKGFFAPLTPEEFDAETNAVMEATARWDAVSLYLTFAAQETAFHGKSIPCEQTPRYIYFLDEIFQILPEARVVNMVRDPRDVLISQSNKWKRRKLGAKSIPRAESFRAWANYHPAMIARLWAGVVRRGRRLSDDPRVMTVRFEALLADPEPTLRAICDHMQIAFEPAMLNVPQIGSSNAANAPDRTGINPAMANGWRKGGLSSADLALCEWVAGEEMRANGYDLATSGRFPVRALPSLALLVAKMSIALPLNLSRTKNLRKPCVAASERTANGRPD